MSPTGGEYATVLEEGLANLFSIEYCRENGHGDNWSSDKKKYTDASKLVEQLLIIDKDIIKKLRIIESTISKIKKELILKLNLSVSIELAENLTMKFKV